MSYFPGLCEHTVNIEQGEDSHKGGDKHCKGCEGCGSHEECGKKCFFHFLRKKSGALSASFVFSNA